MNKAYEGDRIVTAYGRNPKPLPHGLIGEYGTITKVNADGWHDITLESGERISLNNDRYERVN